MDQNPVLLAFNRGVVSPLALGRVDVKRLAMSAEEQTNWLPRTLGAMSLRPGWEYLLNTHQNAAARYVPFIFSVTDTALLELTDSVMRVVVNDTLVTRTAVSTVTTNGNFDANITNWTNTSDAGGTAAWVTGGYCGLTGDGTNAGAVSQTLTVAAGDQNKPHGLRIVVKRGECHLRVGSASGLADYISETQLLPGTHSLELTPTGDIYIQLLNREAYTMLLDSVNIEAAGVMTLPTPWTAARLNSVNFDQSADVVFVASSTKQQRVERRGVHSWSVVDFVSDDGPFRIANTGSITITASALTGAITLTASKPLFNSAHVGALFRLTSVGQNVNLAISSQDTFCDPIQVTGLTAGRYFGVNITGLTGTGNTVTLQRAIGAPGVWVDVANYTTNQSTSVNDGLDNQIIFYRLGIKTGNYSSGTSTVTMAYATGSNSGVARVTSFTSSTVVNANVIEPMGSTVATREWEEGSWSDYRGYPSSTCLHEGRLWWAGKDKLYGSISDTFSSYDDNFVGDAGPISRSIGSGPVDTINWLESMQQLVMGAQMSELMVRSSSLGEPLTPTNLNIKSNTTHGSVAIPALKIDESLLFVGRSGSRVFELSTDAYTLQSKADDLTVLAPELCQPQLVRAAVQRNLDTRVHLVRSDGKVVILTFEKAEDVKCWTLIETDGVIEDVVVLPAAPGVEEDQVYYSVARTVGGVTVRFLEKWAMQSEAVGGTLNKQADAFVKYTGAPTSTVTGLSHLNGRSVVCWADGQDKGTFTVSGGVITLPSPVSNAVVGLPYQARFKSAKLAESGIYLTETKRIDHLGIVLYKTHAQGLQYGNSYDYLDDLPLIEGETPVTANYIWPVYDDVSFELNGTYESDTRLCLVANAPKPCTVIAARLDMTTHGG